MKNVEKKRGLRSLAKSERERERLRHGVEKVRESEREEKRKFGLEPAFVCWCHSHSR